LSDDIISEAIELIENGKEDAASKILARHVLDKPLDEPAWYLLSKCVQEPEKKQFCLEKVLQINPNNQNASRDLNDLNIKPRSIKPSIKKTDLSEERTRPSGIYIRQCPKCGQKINEEEEVCGFCGYNQNSRTLQPTRPSKSTQEISKSITRPASGRKRKSTKRIGLWLLSILISITLLVLWIENPSLFRSIRSLIPFLKPNQITSTPIMQPQKTPTILPTTSPISPTPSLSILQTQENQLDEWEGVKVGMCAGSVLFLHPESEFTKPPEFLGQDSEGFILKWTYPEASLILARRWGNDEIYCYRVQEIQLTK
jgi:ribosomal protein L37E